MDLEHKKAQDEVNHPFMHHKSRRLHVVLLMMFGYFCMSLMTTNIGITLNCMINSTAIVLDVQEEEHLNVSQLVSDPIDPSQPQTCGQLEATVVNDYGGSYDWSVKMQGYIIGSTFLGGMLAALPAGMAIDRYSVRHLLLFSILLLSFASLTLPLFAEYVGPVAVVVLRFLMGVGEGMMIPGLGGMITRWVPLHEKSMAASIFTSGNQLAGIFGNPAAARLCDSSVRWPAVFYISGGLGLVWVVLWQLTVNNSPANSKWISEQEVEYLEYHVPRPNRKEKRRGTPWKAMWTSPAFLCLVFCSILTNMMLTLILVYIPTYFKEVLFLDVKQNGVMTAIPLFANLVIKLLWSILMDHLKQKKILTPTQSCKLSQGLSMVLLTICFLALAYMVDCSTPTLAVCLFCAICGAFGLSISGFLTSMLSIAPYHIGIMGSINQIVGFGGRVATPQLMTYFKKIGTAEEWKGILVVYAVMCASSAVVFTLWGSGDVQWWNDTTVPKKQKERSNELVDQTLLLQKNGVQKA